MSRKLYPKQFQALTTDLSLFQECARRVGCEHGYRAPIVICNDDHRFIAAEQLRLVEVQPEAILLEPVSRNTAPAIAAAAVWLSRKDPDAVMAVFPSDHVISDGDAFRVAINDGATLASDGYMVAFCVEPDRPHTGYGYIKCGPAVNGSEAAFTIEQFVEKPSRDKAEEFLRQGVYRWNAGIFMFSVRTMLDELSELQPAIVAGAEAAATTADEDLSFLRLNAQAFESCPSISIDHALMEKTDRGVAVRLDAGWHDVGSWDALWDIGAKDAKGNVAVGDVTLENVSNSYVRSEAGLIAVTGIEDLVVIATRDATFIGPREDTDAARAIVDVLKSADRGELTTHTRQYRPWGYYEVLGGGPGFQVKHLSLNPGAKISLQKHEHRSEHWVAVSGSARVACGDKAFTLRENESTYIPKGAKHRLENIQDQPISIVEVQTGDELREDDIVRFEDLYRRQ